jgi:excinuclease ABC subunit A
MIQDNNTNNERDKIIIRGAREHNLKNIDVEIPKNKFVVITGLSGSGKSSLAFDTIFAEGQRRYVESLSSYAKQFLGNLEKPDVDIIKGLSPAISIDQRSASNNPRSTVGTVTEIYDYLRILFARVGRPHCPNCGNEITKQTPNQIVEQIMSKYSEPTKIEIYAPIIRQKKGEHRYALVGAKKAKYVKVRIDNVIMDIEEALDLKIDKKSSHNIDVFVGEIVCHGSMTTNETNELYKLIQKGLELSGGFISIADAKGNDHVYSKLYTCPDCGLSIPEVTPSSFSFNNPAGACEVCGGLGIVEEVDPNAVFPNTKLTLAEGAVRPWTRITSQHGAQTKSLVRIAEKYNFDLDTPVEELTDDKLKIVLYGEPESEKLEEGYFEGVIPDLEKGYRETDSDYIRNEIAKYLVKKTCPSCKGQRLRREVLAITIAGKNIVDIAKLSIEKCLEFFKELPKSLTKAESQIASQILIEINLRLKFLCEVGVAYLTLDRNAATLAGGEAQRIRLATQLGSQLTGIVYILDEPSIGLHQRDNDKLLETLKDLRDLGNTVIVVEHDEETMRAADYIFDIGPGAGDYGGEVVAQGTVEEIINNPNSVTGKYLSGKSLIALPKQRRKGLGKYLTVTGAKEFNLKNVTAKIPLNSFVAISGVSGSGKSTLIFDIIARALSQKLHRTKAVPGEHKQITG